MRRGVVLVGVGVAVLLGGSAGTVFWATGDAPAPVTHTVASTAPVAALDPAAPVERPRASPPLLRPNPATSRSVRAGLKSGAEAPSATPLASRVLSKAVRKALLASEVQSRLASCVDRDIGYGGGAKPGRTPRAAPPILLLELETSAGEAKIVDVLVQSWGGAGPDIVACATDALRGRVVRNARVTGNQRLRVGYPLHPRNDVVASAPVTRGE